MKIEDQNLTPFTRTFRLEAKAVWKFTDLAMNDTTWGPPRSRCYTPLRTLFPGLLRRGI